MTNYLLLLGPLLGLLFSASAWSYPEFIGYKYASCLTCHYNSQGNGPLNDYGRALWSAEIAGKTFSGHKTDEQLGESSGFLGKTQLPWWIRPGVKARELMVTRNPGGSNATTTYILMQAEGNLALFFDQDQKYALVGSFGYVPIPAALKGTPAAPDEEWISREHYFRWQTTENLWLYLGKMDKVYGIRTINHTAYSRQKTGLAMNDQAHGLVAHYIQPTWELSGNIFAGNMEQEADLRQQGASMMYEKELKEAWRLGTSILYSSNKYIKNTRFGVHTRYGFGHGSALLFEIGLIDDAPKAGSNKQGYYMFSEAIQKVGRGWHVFLSGQSYKDELIARRPDNFKSSLGILAFPMARTEFRMEVENTKQFYATPEVKNDSWSLLAQIHLSL